jgi:uncharacterized delta-60 repeat protein
MVTGSAGVDGGNAVSIDNLGRILVAGQTTDLTQGIYNSLVLRFDSSGNPDNSFNGSGSVILDINAQDNFATNLLLQPDGKIIITGHSTQVSDDFLLARFHDNGSIDSSFNTTGFAVHDIGSATDHSLSSALQQDGKIILSGFSTAMGMEGYVLSRYINDSTVTLISNLQNKKIEIYPQPARNILFINSSDITDFEIIIFDLCGKEIIKPGINSVNYIDISGIPAGIYILKLNNGKENYLTKFLKTD